MMKRCCLPTRSGVSACLAGANETPRCTRRIGTSCVVLGDRLKIFDMTAQLQHGIERFRRRAVREAGWQFVPPLLKLVQQAGQGLHRVSPLLRSTAPVGGPTV